MTKASKIAITVAIIFAIFILLIVTAIGIFKWNVDKKPHVIDEKSLTIAGENYTVTLIQVGDPDFPFGATTARVELRLDGKKIDSFTVDVADDGANLSPKSWDVFILDERTGDIAVTLFGSEQEPDTHIFFLSLRID